MGPAARTTIVDVPQTHWARTVDGASIAYQDIGDGPVTLVVIHGWVSHLEVYWEQPRYVRFVRRLSRDMRVLLFDKRGIGMSDRVAGAPDLGVLLDDVRAVMDAAGVERAALLGWGDPGPQLAAFFAATHPERTLCLALSGSLHARWEPDYPWGETEDQFEEHIRETVHHWGTLAGASAFIRRGYCGDDLERLKVPPYNQPEFADWNARLARFSATPSSFEAFERMWFLTDIRPLLASIAVPTAVFFVAGDRDDEDYARAEGPDPDGGPRTLHVPQRGRLGPGCGAAGRPTGGVHLHRRARRSPAGPHSGHRPVHRRRLLDGQGV